ncbi:hypothetical protein ELI_2768 [Eubacterium callanderi]|uniref:Uncharacterized protein n=1 Tax=Eubacterium callanderi TaxID=53442 RepID=E3GER9_9FIRM|nr:hypothetical protein ELI_2768 [Eubacterium callanderi]
MIFQVKDKILRKRIEKAINRTLELKSLEFICCRMRLCHC